VTGRKASFLYHALEFLMISDPQWQAHRLCVGVRSAARHKTALASTAVKRRTALISLELLEAERDVAKARALSLRMLGGSVIDYVTEAALPLGAFALAIWPVAATTRRSHISAMHPCGGIAHGRTHQFSCRVF
jgi:hypothetical protein